MQIRIGYCEAKLSIVSLAYIFRQRVAVARVKGVGGGDAERLSERASERGKERATAAEGSRGNDQ